MIKVCCVCRKFKHEEKWRNDIAITNKQVSHVYCPLCFEDLMDKVDRYALKKWSAPVYTFVEAG